MILGEVKARPKDIISFSLDYYKQKQSTDKQSVIKPHSTRHAGKAGGFIYHYFVIRIKIKNILVYIYIYIQKYSLWEGALAILTVSLRILSDLWVVLWNEGALPLPELR